VSRGGPAIAWWRGKIGRFRGHLRSTVRPEEREELAGWLTPAQLALFEAMPVADRRHGLDVVAALRTAGHGNDRELLLAGLLHDAGKGPRVRLWHRVAWSLTERYGAWIAASARRLPGGREGLERLAHHADRSAELARAAGASERTAALIRHRAAPQDGPALEALRLADEGS